MTEMLTQLTQQWQQQSSWEIIAVLLAYAYVWLAAKANRWCWPCGFASTAIYTVLFWQVSLPFQSVLNGYYMLMAVYGWLHWRGAKGNEELPMAKWSSQRHGLFLLLLMPVSLGLGMIASHWFVSEHVYLDAGVMVFSLFATYVMTQKIAEHWLYWIVIDVVSGYLFWQQGLYLTGVLFYSYFLFSIYGYYQWRLKLKLQPA